MPTISKLDQALANIDERIEILMAARAVLLELKDPKDKGKRKPRAAKAPNVPGSQD